MIAARPQLHELTRGDESRCKLEGVHKNAVARIFIVESKARAVMADAMHALGIREPLEWLRDRTARRPRLAISGLNGLLQCT